MCFITISNIVVTRVKLIVQIFDNQIISLTPPIARRTSKNFFLNIQTSMFRYLITTEKKTFTIAFNKLIITSKSLICKSTKNLSVFCFYNQQYILLSWNQLLFFRFCERIFYIDITCILIKWHIIIIIYSINFFIEVDAIKSISLCFIK